MQLGHGRYQQRIQATVTGRTSHIAVELASDKEETNKILATLGLPVPQQELVQTEGQAARAARRIGYPVVTKPYNGNHGRGISIKLMTDDEVVQGFRVAKEHSRSVIVETYLEGDDHRLLVVNGELVAATRRTPGHVVGDGVKNIVDLIEVVNQDPRRGVGHEKVLTRLELDAPGAEDAGEGGTDARSRCRRPARSCTCAPPRTCRRAARRPTSPTSSIPTIATWPCAPCRPWASTSAASTSSRPTSPRATARSAAASAR